MFGVGRTTVREALRGLAAENLITTKRGVTGGSSVAEPSVERLKDRLQLELTLVSSASDLSYEDFVELRRVIEIPATALAAERRADDELSRLQSLPPSNGPARALQLYRRGRDFHFAVVEMAHNPLLRIAAEPVFLVVQTSLDRARLSNSFHAAVTRQHRAIAEAIAEHDAAGAAELMRDHLEWLEPRYRRVWRGPREQNSR